jgi:GT2 family glycosyltransferase
MRNAFEVLVVDNGSTDGSQRMLREQFPAVRVIQNDGNVGFCRASNQGIEATRAPYILLLNSDTVVNERSLDALIDFMAATGDAGAVGGTLVNEDGSFQASFNRFSSLAEEVLVGTGLGRLLWPGYPSHHTAAQARAVDWVCAACLLVRRAALEDVGLLDERYVMYGDEADLQYRLARAGWKVYFLPEATTVHLGGRSQDRWRRRRMVYRGKMLFYRCNYGAFAEYALRTMLGVLTLGKAAAWMPAWLVPSLHRRAALELRSNSDVLRLCIKLE